jgi:hypothetical protein
MYVHDIGLGPAYLTNQGRTDRSRAKIKELAYPREVYAISYFFGCAAPGIRYDNLEIHSALKFFAKDLKMSLDTSAVRWIVFAYVEYSQLGRTRV